MDNRELFDRDKLIHQLQGIHSDQPAHEAQAAHSAQPPTVYGAERAELERRAADGLEAQKRLQEATKAAESGKITILKGLQTGEDVHRLFLVALDTISRASDDAAFRVQTIGLLRTVYAGAFGNVPALRDELEAVEGRTERLRAYLSREDIDQRDREIARRALAEHERKAAQLREQINATA